MTLAFQLGNLDEVPVGQLRRLRQNRSGDCNFIMTREGTNNAMRRVFDGRQSGAEFRKGLGFNLCDQVCEHIVK